MGLSYDDYREGYGGKVGIKRKMGTKNAKLLLGCAGNEDTNKQITNLKGNKDKFYIRNYEFSSAFLSL